MHVNQADWKGIPSALTSKSHWVVWKYEVRGNPPKPTKVPYTPLTSSAMSRASSTDPATWGSFKEALQAISAAHGKFNGIGFVLRADGDIVGVDLDDCFDDATRKFTDWKEAPEGTPSAEEIVDFLNSYTEVTPSGKGVRIFMFGSLPAGRRRLKDIEMYNSGRFLTVTGNHLEGAAVEMSERSSALAMLHKKVFGDQDPPPKAEQYTKTEYSSATDSGPGELSDDDIIKMAGRAANGSKFRALWGGSTAGYATPSEADQALCSILAFWTQSFDQLDRLMRRSGLARNKWLLRADYRVNTINRSLVGLNNTYKGRSEDSNDDQGSSGGGRDDSTDRFLLEASLSDKGNAECMVALYRDMFRYCHDLSNSIKLEGWLVWDEGVWQKDYGKEAERAALDVIAERKRVAGAVLDDTRRKKLLAFAEGSWNSHRQKAMLRTASILSSFSTRISEYDNDPWLAGTLNGTLDLRTGECREPERDDMITMKLGARYDPKAKPDRWLTFLDEVFNNDQELIQYLQRAIGYSLTGSWREQKMFFLVGEGSNGKSTFLSILRALMGNYGDTAAFVTFDADRRSEASNDVAGLRGKRFVTIIETNDDRRLDEQRIKSVTGGDEIKCRFLYSEDFVYTPEFKLWMAVNHKPLIRGTDFGIWRRIQLIEFTQTYVDKDEEDLKEGEHKKDKYLEKKLRAELPGILNWAIEGLLDWLENGLGEPESIRKATESYRKESDLVGVWFLDCAHSKPDTFTKASDAYASYAGWCKSFGHRALSQISFGRTLVSKGYRADRYKMIRGYWGFELATSLPDDEI